MSLMRRHIRTNARKNSARMMLWRAMCKLSHMHRTPMLLKNVTWLSQIQLCRIDHKVLQEIAWHAVVFDEVRSQGHVTFEIVNMTCSISMCQDLLHIIGQYFSGILLYLEETIPGDDSSLSIVIQTECDSSENLSPKLSVQVEHNALLGSSAGRSDLKDESSCKRQNLLALTATLAQPFSKPYSHDYSLGLIRTV